MSHLPQSRCIGLELRVCGCCDELRNAHVVDYSRAATRPELIMPLPISYASVFNKAPIMLDKNGNYAHFLPIMLIKKDLKNV